MERRPDRIIQTDGDFQGYLQRQWDIARQVLTNAGLPADDLVEWA